mmetsp:Transcript_90304/g.188834  ORF Transcript_90304/g.188834 Transcript_90304/m.188834 type:complete len:214 (-) Transcript_90304:401-1042(-)
MNRGLVKVRLRPAQAMRMKIAIAASAITESFNTRGHELVLFRSQELFVHFGRANRTDGRCVRMPRFTERLPGSTELTVPVSKSVTFTSTRGGIVRSLPGGALRLRFVKEVLSWAKTFKDGALGGAGIPAFGVAFAVGFVPNGACGVVGPLLASEGRTCDAPPAGPEDVAAGLAFLGGAVLEVPPTVPVLARPAPLPLPLPAFAFAFALDFAFG